MCRHCFHHRKEREWQEVEYMRGAMDRKIDLMKEREYETRPRPLLDIPRPLNTKSIYYKAGYDGVFFKFD